MSEDGKILVLNIATDSKDTSLGFAISWLNEFSKNYLEVDVITLNKGDTSPLNENINCLLYTSPSPRDRTRSRMPSSA